MGYGRTTNLSLSFESIPLKEVVEEVLADLELKILQMAAKVELESLPVIEADRVQMRQLFQNIISNSLKFSKKEEYPVIQIRGVILTDNCVEIIIRDNGIGFDEKYLEQIFQPFKRLHTREEFEGSGLGLALCQHIVQSHGGEITAQSLPGQGSKFLILLPLKQEPPAEPSYEKKP